jgi:hypothetical protein
MTIRFWKWLIVVLAAAAIVLALRHSMETPEDDPTLGRTTAPALSADEITAVRFSRSVTGRA